MRQPSAAFGSILVSLLAASCLPVAFFLPSGEGEEGFGRLYLYLYAASILVGFLVLVCGAKFKPLPRNDLRSAHWSAYRPVLIISEDPTQPFEAPFPAIFVRLWATIPQPNHRPNPDSPW